MDDIVNDGLPPGGMEFLTSKLSPVDPNQILMPSPGATGQTPEQAANSMTLLSAHSDLLQAGALNPTTNFDINTTLAIGGPLNKLLPESIQKYTSVDVPLPSWGVDATVGFGRSFIDLYDNVGKYSKYSIGGALLWDVADKVMKANPGKYSEEEIVKAMDDLSPLAHPTYMAADGKLELSAYEEWLNSRDEENNAFNQTAASMSWAGIGGRLGAEVLMSIPLPLALSKTVAGAAMSGMALGGAQALAFTRVPEGQSVLPYVALGGILGGGLAAGFAKFGPMLSETLGRGTRITADDIASMQERMGVPVNKAQETADILNAELEGMSRGIGKQVRETMENLPGRAAAASGGDPVTSLYKRTLNALHNEDLLDAVDFIDLYSGKATSSDLLNRLVARSQLDEFDTALGALDDMEWASAKEFNQLRGFRKKFGKQSDAVRAQARRTEKAYKAMRAAETTTEDIYNLKRKLWHKQEQKMMDMVGQSKTMPTLNEVDEVYRAMNVFTDADAAKAGKFSPFVKKKAQLIDREIKATRQLQEMGFIDSQLLPVIAAGGVGAAIGANENEGDPLVGATYGFLMGAAGGFAMRKLAEQYAEKKIAETSVKLGLRGTAAKLFARDGKKLYHALSGYSWRKSGAVVGSYGRPGRLLADGIEAARDSAEGRIGVTLTNMREVLIKNGVVKHHRLLDTYENMSGGDFRAYMQGELPNAPKNIRAAGEHVKRSLMNVLEEAENVGVISPKEYLKFKDTLKNKGYWPRIYNRRYLQTPEGRDHFIRALASEKFNEETLEDVVNTLVGKDSKYIKEIMALAKKDGTSRYVTREMALRILKHHSVRERVGRSTHLENARKLHVEAERILNPFMIDDPIQVMTRYFDDVYREIENARVFGAKDEIFEGYAEQIGQKYGSAEQDLAMEMYYTTVGDPASRFIKAAINLPDTIHAAMGSAGAWANLHLLFSQMVNFNQAGVFGSVYAARHGFKGVRAIMDASVDWAKNAEMTLPSGLKINAREWAAMTGADLETTMYQYIGEASAMSNYLMGSNITAAVHGSGAYKAGGKFNPLAQIFDTLNDQNKFLKTIMFTPVEKMQRQMGAVMGYRYANVLYKELDFVLSAKGAGKGSKAHKNVLASLDELKLPHTYSAVTDEDMLRAGLRMSNKINFRNTADQLPLWWSHPYMSPFKRFKTFAYHTMNFLGDQGASGNWKGMGLYAVLGATLGTGVFTLRDKVRSVVTGREEYLEGEDVVSWKRIQGGMMALGGMGLLMDALYQSSSEGDLFKTIAGPAPTDLASIIIGAKKSLGGDPSHAVNAFVKAAPPPIGIPAGYAAGAVTGRNPLHKKKSEGTARGRSHRRRSRYRGL